jgi:hypothetical protein
MANQPKEKPVKHRLIGVVLAVLCTVVIVDRAAAGPTTDPNTAAGYGGGYLARQINSSGFIPKSATDPAANIAGTVDAALALAAANVGGGAFTRALNYLHGQIDAYVKDSGGVDQPGSLAKLIMLAVVAGEDPANFGGTAPANNLRARLNATKRTSGTDAGLFGAQSPTYDGAFRQSLSIVALRASGSPPADAVAWLSNQQCPDKGWQAYRADITTPCDATDPATFAGEDTNSTAIAAQAFSALSVAPSKGNPLDFLNDAQNSDGGLGYLKGTVTDANSTGLTIQAIVAGAEDPTAGRWAIAGGTPLTALLALQLGCDAATADRGAFDFQKETPLKANLLATVQAVPGAARKPFPLAAGTPSQSEPAVDCGGTQVTTTTTTTPSTTTTVLPAATTSPIAPPATPIKVQPKFTG